MKKLKYIAFIFLVLLFLNKNIYARNIRIIVNGEDITEKSAAKIESDRVLVPIRFISEALGKEVKYNEATNEVIITDINSTVKNKIGTALFEINNNEYILSDVKSKVFNNRTYVPVRVIAETLNKNVKYDFNTNTVSIQDGSPDPDDGYSVFGLKETITEPTEIIINAGKNIQNKIEYTKLFLMDTVTRKAVINDMSYTNTVQYIPWDLKSFKGILVVSYDKTGNVVAGRGMKVNSDFAPKIGVSGIKNGESYSDSVNISPDLNFLPEKISYDVQDTDTLETVNYPDKDPYAPWQLALSGGQSKNLKVTLNVYDRSGNIYRSDPISFSLSTPEKFSLIGVKNGENINGVININVSRNFDVTSTRYFLSDGNSETLLVEKPYGNHLFVPEENLNGRYFLRAEVDLPNGTTKSTDIISVNIKGGKKLLLTGIGPDAVITDSTDLHYYSNLKLNDINYMFEGENGFSIKGNLDKKTGFDSKKYKNGYYTVYATANTPNGKIESDRVKVRIFNGEIFKPTAVISKNDFLNYFSKLAVNSYNLTSMSSSIQLAQAILETGWGQYVPVDKYTGKISRNLFGIKGSASNGYVISNTWEEYNGVRYRIDDKFRAYKNVEESWNDHKNLLLTKERYKIFRDVMFDPIRASYAIRRAGYATDSEYPKKLLNIIKTNKLSVYDEVEF